MVKKEGKKVMKRENERKGKRAPPIEMSGHATV